MLTLLCQITPWVWVGAAVAVLVAVGIVDEVESRDDEIARLKAEVEELVVRAASYRDETRNESRRADAAEAREAHWRTEALAARVILLPTGNPIYANPRSRDCERVRRTYASARAANVEG